MAKITSEAPSALSGPLVAPPGVHQGGQEALATPLGRVGERGHPATSRARSSRKWIFGPARATGFVREIFLFVDLVDGLNTRVLQRRLRFRFWWYRFGSRFSVGASGKKV